MFDHPGLAFARFILGLVTIAIMLDGLVVHSWLLAEWSL